MTQHRTSPLNTLWKVRLKQDETAVLSCLREIKSELGLDSLDSRALSQWLERPSSRTSSVTQSRALAIEASLAWSSLLRLQGRHEECLEQIAQIQSVCRAQIEPPRFRLSFESGITLFALGRYLEALDQFMSAQSLAQSKLEQILSTSNLLWCLENLGCATEATESQLSSVVSSLSEGESKEFSQILSQWGAYQMRKAFREGRFNEIHRLNQDSMERSGLHQGSFQAQWALELPYHRFFKPLDSEALIRARQKAPFIYQTHGLFRTLSDLTHPDDAKSMPLSDQVDRLYLWVWRWLLQPDTGRSALIQSTLQVLLRPEIFGRLTADDRSLLVLSLSWLKAVDPAIARRLEPAFEALGGVRSSRSPLFELECLFIHWLIARRDGDSVSQKSDRALLGHHPLWESGNLHFKAWVSMIEDGQAPTGRKNRHDIPRGIQMLLSGSPRAGGSQEPAAKKRSSLQIVVDLEKNLIKDCTGVTRRSETLCIGFYLLKDDSQIRIEDFAAQAFGITRFDELTHYRKVVNLLSRMKALLGGSVHFGIRDQWVYRDEALDLIEWVLPSSGALLLRQSKLARPKSPSMTIAPSKGALRKQSKNVHPAFLDGKTRFNRTDLESHLKISKSAAHRIIQKWLSEGRIRALARNRASQYQILLPTERGVL